MALPEAFCIIDVTLSALCICICIYMYRHTLFPSFFPSLSLSLSLSLPPSLQSPSHSFFLPSSDQLLSEVAADDQLNSRSPSLRLQSVKVCSGVFYSCAEKGGHHEPLLQKKFGIKV